jgi:two-component system chemotaxis response regulator CheY
MDFSKVKVLVVDDMPGTVSLIQRMLSEMGLSKVEEAYDGRDALKRLDEEPFDIIISDYSMRHVNGLDLLKALKENPKCSNVPFLMISAKSDFTVMEDALDQGAAAYIFKPVDYQLLKNAVFSLVQRKLAESAQQDSAQ